MVNENILGSYVYLLKGGHEGKLGIVGVNEQLSYYLRYKGDFESGHTGKVIVPDSIPPYLITVLDNGRIVCFLGAYESDFEVISSSANPCGIETISGGDGVTETVHILPEFAGRVRIQYDMLTIPDMIEVFFRRSSSNLELIHTSEDFISYTGTISFDYDPAVHPRSIMVRVTGSRAGTAWHYTVLCPE